MTVIATPCSEHVGCPVWFDVPAPTEGPLPQGHRVVQRHGVDVVQRKCTEHRHHPDDWFEDPGSGRETTAGKARRRARDACWMDCPRDMRLTCLDAGLRDENLNHGIWGGYTEAQRQAISDGIAARVARQSGVE